MNEAIKQAALTLGDLILESPEFIHLEQQEDAAMEDEALQGLYREYSQARQEMQELLMQDAPDAQAIDKVKQEVEHTQDLVQNNDTMQALSLAREAFSDLMGSINAQIQDVLHPRQEIEEGASCGSGGCAGCSGCGGH